MSLPKNGPKLQNLKRLKPTLPLLQLLINLLSWNQMPRDLRQVNITKVEELNTLRRNVFASLDTLAKEQSDLEVRLGQQLKKGFETAPVDLLDSKLEELRADILNFGKSFDAEKDSSQLQLIEAKLTELQSKIARLEADLVDLKAAAKNCCRNETFVAELVKSHLTQWLNEDFGRWNESTLLLKSQLEATLKKFGDDLRDEILSSASVKMRSIADEEAEKTVQHILSDVVAKIGRKNNLTAGGIFEKSSSTFAREEIEKMIRNALVTYDADKTGLFDFALETAGGSVVSTRCTEAYVRTGASYTLFGIPIWWPSNNPRTAIQVF